MKKLFLLILAIAFLLAPLAPAKAAYVRGYTRSNGTYVQPYYRSNPNGLLYDNYSYRPSQPLYNNSYYKYDTYKWTTPSWNTQSDYYTGLNSYKSRSSLWSY